MEAKGTDAIITKAGDGCIQGTRKLTNNGKFNSLFYIEFIIGKNSERLNFLCYGLVNELDTTLNKTNFSSKGSFFFSPGGFYSNGTYVCSNLKNPAAGDKVGLLFDLYNGSMKRFLNDVD